MTIIISFNLRILLISQGKRACFYVLSLRCASEMQDFFLFEIQAFQAFIESLFQVLFLASLWEISKIQLANIICEGVTKQFLPRLLVCVGVFWWEW